MTLSSATASTTSSAVWRSNPERIQPGQEPLQRQPDAAGAFGAMKRLDLPPVAVALDRAAQEHDQIDHAVEAPEFVAFRIERLRVGARRRQIAR